MILHPTSSQTQRPLWLPAVLLAAALLAAGLLAGCGQPVQIPTAPAAASPTPAAAPASTQRSAHTPTPTPVRLPAVTPTSALAVRPAELQGQKVLFWHPYRAQAQAALEQLAGQFNQDNEWGIQVELVSQGSWGVLDEKMRQASADSEHPDLIVGYNNQALVWDAGGWLLEDQAPYTGDSAWGLAPGQQDGFFPAIWAQDFVPDGLLNGKPVVGGKRLGLPWYRSALLLYYNATWGRELGFSSAPRTLAELRLQACAGAKANRSDPDPARQGSGGWLIGDDPALFSSLVFAFGGEIARPDRTGYKFNTPQSQAAMQYLVQLYNDGCAWRDAEANPLDDFAGRRALFIAASSAETANLQAAMAQQASQDEWIALPFFSEQGQPVVDVFGPALLIAQSNPARQLAAWLFARWLVGPENQAQWASANGYLPVAAPAAGLMSAMAGLLPQARQALDDLPYGHPEPAYASWGAVRPAQAETINFLLAPDVKPEAISGILQQLDQLTAEIHSQYR